MNYNEWTWIKMNHNELHIIILNYHELQRIVMIDYELMRMTTNHNEVLRWNDDYNDLWRIHISMLEFIDIFRIHEAQTNVTILVNNYYAIIALNKITNSILLLIYLNLYLKLQKI